MFLNDEPVEQVDSFNYLGSLITIDKNCATEIKTIAVAKQATTQLNLLWKSLHISAKLKEQLMKSLVWSVALYGAKSWSLKSTDLYQLDRAQNQCLCNKTDWCERIRTPVTAS